MMVANESNDNATAFGRTDGPQNTVVVRNERIPYLFTTLLKHSFVEGDSSLAIFDIVSTFLRMLMLLVRSSVPTWIIMVSGFFLNTGLP